MNNNAQPDPQVLADELMACGSALELKRIKLEHGDVAVKTAWKLLPQSERDRIKQLCAESQPEPQLHDSSEFPATYPENVARVDAWLKKEGLLQSQPEPEPPHQLVEPEPQPHSKPRTLFSISKDLERLNELLNDCDDAQQQELIGQWFESVGQERNRKLDGYAALITEMISRAAALDFSRTLWPSRVLGGLWCIMNSRFLQ